MASGKSYNNKNSKKLQEVKEVIQNKSDNDISKILEVFDNDVSKTINAFMTDDGKDALSKWSSMKKKAKQQDKNQSEASASAAEESASKTSPGKKGNKKQQQQTSANSNNKAGAGAINDLVSLIINQSISTTGTTTPQPQQPAASVQPTSLNAQIEQQQSILNNLNNLIIGNQSNQSKFGGLNVKVLGIEQPKDTAVKATNNQSSVTSSPSSMSSTSTFDKDNKQVQSNTQSNSNRQKMPQNAGNTNTNLPQHPLNSHINRSYTNPNNTKNVLGSFQKDLQRQSQQLTRTSAQFQEELSKSQMNINQTFMLLRNMLDQRQAQLQAELTSVARNAVQTLSQRQQKASQLKVLGDNVVHLNDQDTLELKADMKHFINERLLDEEFGKVKVFSEDNYDQLHEAIGNYGRVVQLNHIKYATSRPPVDKVLDANYKAAAPVVPQPQKTNNNTSSAGKKNNNNGNKTPAAAAAVTNKSVSNGKHSVKIIDVDTLSDEDNEGEFIEVKKPQRNKNKQSTNGPLPTNGASATNQNGAGKKSQANGNANGHHQEANGMNGNGAAPSTTSNKKKKQKQNATTPASLKSIPKANQNPFSLIANGQC